jgi:hypothetical protein
VVTLIGVTVSRRQVATGQFALPMPATEAIGWFTPEGERDWVPGWDPVYAAGRPSETAGTVFVTDVDATPTIWVIHAIDRDRHEAAYARVTPGHHAGAVRVRCAAADGGCLVSVRYDMTLLSGADPTALYRYSDQAFADTMQEWSHAIGKAVAR